MSAVASSGNTLKWYDINDNLLATGATGPVPSTASAGSVTYKVTQTDANGCESLPLNISVTTNALPTISVVGGASQSVCNGESLTLSGSGAGSGGSYSWTGGISNGVSFTPTSSSSYTVTGTDGNGCSNTATATVTVNPLPAAPTVDPSNVTQYCLGATSSAMSAVASSGNTLKWYDINDNLLATGATGPVPSTASAGSVTYKVTQTNGTSQCESSALLITVTVVNLPTISVVGGASQSVCDGSSVTLNGSGAGSGGSYSWTGGISNGVSFTPTSSSSYTVTGTDGNGCSNTAKVTVTVNTPPIISVVGGASQSVCNGESLTLSGSGAGSGGSYSWTGGISNGVSFTPTSSSSYTVTGTDGNGCSNTATATVTVNTPPTINAGADVTICAGESVTLTGSGAGTGGSYSWTGGVSNGVSFTPTATTTYTVTGTDANGCSATDQVTVTVNPLPAAPTVDPSNVTQYCLGATSSAMSAVASSGNTLKWYDINDNLLATGLRVLCRLRQVRAVSPTRLPRPTVRVSVNLRRY